MLLKRIYAILILFALTSCGFQPVYNDNNKGGRLSEIKVGNISYASNVPSRESRALRGALEHELNWSYTDSQKKYILDVSYTLSIEGAAIQSNALATRNNLKINLNYILKDIITDKIIEQNTLVGIESFDIPSSPYSNYVSKEEIAVRVAKSLATELRLRLIGMIK